MSENRDRFSRRDLLRLATGLVGGLIISPVLQACQKLGLVEPTEPPVPTSTPAIHVSNTSTPAAPAQTVSTPTTADSMARVALVRTRDRQEGVRRAISLLGENHVRGKKVFLKPNFNSADPAPASTHPDTLRALVESLGEMGAGGITIADRSGMGDTRRVMEKLGVFDLGSQLGYHTLVFDELTDPDDWVLVKNPGDHWKNGFPVPRQLLEAEAIVQTCCLKPHRFGGHFTLSLKNTIGMVGKFQGSGGHNYMTELHTSFSQRLMIAETNRFYQPALVLLDGVEAFIDRGPDSGTKVWGEAILAGTDRVAIDAAGLALLRLLGYMGKAARGAIFAQEQIARAVELGLGIQGPDKISFITDDPDSAAYAAQIHELMRSSG
jgi:uncharacterized protein (DUF362 family)